MLGQLPWGSFAGAASLGQLRRDGYAGAVPLRQLLYAALRGQLGWIIASLCKIEM